MSAIQLTTVERPPYAITNLRRLREGEIVVRRHGRQIERRRFNLASCPCGEPIDHTDLMCPSCESRR